MLVFFLCLLGQCKYLERALDEWSLVLKSGKVHSVRNPKQTCSAITVMAALFKLMGKVAKNCVLVFVLNSFLSFFLLVFVFNLFLKYIAFFSN